jgi:hypothetical protein
MAQWCQWGTPWQPDRPARYVWAVSWQVGRPSGFIATGPAT